MNFTEHYVLSSKCYIVDEDLDTKLLGAYSGPDGRDGNECTMTRRWDT